MKLKPRYANLLPARTLHTQQDAARDRSCSRTVCCAALRQCFAASRWGKNADQINLSRTDYDDGALRRLS